MAFTFPTAINTSTLNAWLKQIEEPAYHTNPLLAYARKRGTIKHDAAKIGTRLNWNVNFYRHKLNEVEAPVTDRAFNSALPKVPVGIDWCGYELPLQITKLERLINSSSATRLYNLIETTLREANDDFWADFGLKMWQDGNQTTKGLHGYLSLIGGSSTLSADECYNTLGSYSQLTPADANEWWACANAQTYAGLACALGNKLNSWSGDSDEAWPAGHFPEGYHAWHNIICDYNSNYFTPTTGSTHNFDTQWQQAFNAVETYQTKLCKVPVDLWICDADLVMRAKNSLISGERFNVGSTSEARSLGFPAVSYNGWELLPGYGVPDGMCAGFTFDKMEICSLQKQFVSLEEDRDIRSSTDLRLLDCYCQMKFASPKYFPCMVPATAEGT